MASQLAHVGTIQSEPNSELIYSFEDAIEAVELPPAVTAVVDKYEDVMGERDRYLWRWIYSLFDAFTLSSVTDDRFDSVRNVKTIFTVFITALDDLVEKRGDTETFEQARRLPYCPETVDRHAGGVDAAVLEFVTDTWQAVRESLDEAPRYGDFAATFAFDLRQAFNAIDYAHLTNENLALANLEGAFHYGSHNMVLFPYTDIDLMYSPTFDRAELGALREVVWEVQEMARIGNWLTTWERELHEGDFTAGTVVYALQRDVVSIDELTDAGEDVVPELAARIRRAEVEEHFLAEWRRRFDSVSRRVPVTRTVDLEAFVQGMATVMQYHLASRGRK